MTVIERFLKYVTFDTQSDESTGVTPSTAKQMVFAQYLKTELEALGLEEISLDENGYLLQHFRLMWTGKFRPLVSLLTWIQVRT